MSAPAWATPQTSAPAQDASIPNDQLDSLVAPIALYPDPLLAQVLAASTYPLELVQLQQWLAKNKNLKDKSLADAVQKQPWDPSVQAMAQFPDVVKQMVDGIQWTTDLGNAFLAQQNDVMDAVQRMRIKAKDSGNLKSSDQLKVETKVVESKNVVVIEQSNPEVVYVPSYNPSVMWGPPAYPYPPVAYPPAGYYAAGMALSFGVGVAMGAAWGGGWGWNTGWGGNNNININNNNTFVNNSNRQNYAKNSNRQNLNNSGNRGNSWQHNPQHRGGTPYSNHATANRFGGTARGDSMANRQANARQNQGQIGNRQQGGSLGGGGRQPAGNFGGGGSGSLGGNRGGGAGGGGLSGGRGSAGAGGSGLSGTRGSGGAAGSGLSGNRGGGSAGGGGNLGGGGDRIGSRNLSSGGGSSRGGGAFSGGSGMSGGAARASSQRGSFSRGGGGGGRGGGRRR